MANKQPDKCAEENAAADAVLEKMIDLGRKLQQSPVYISSESFVDKGMELYKSEDYENALNAFEEALKIQPYNETALNGKGVSLAALKRFDEALPVFDQILKLYPNEEDALVNKGMVLAGLGKYDQALGVINTTLYFYPTDAMAWKNKAAVLARTGKMSEAEDCYKKYQALLDAQQR